MKYIGTNEIETPRLLLRKFKLGDETSMFNNYCYDPLVTKYLTWNAHTSITMTKSFLDFMIKKYEDNSNFAWAITLKGDVNNVVGSIDVVRLNTELEEVEIGYVLSRSLWNKKIMSEALEGVIDYLFNKADVKIIKAKHAISNVNSGKVMKHNHMKYIGVENALTAKDNEVVVCAVYSLKK